MYTIYFRNNFSIHILLTMDLEKLKNFYCATNILPYNFETYATNNVFKNQH